MGYQMTIAEWKSKHDEAFANAYEIGYRTGWAVVVEELHLLADRLHNQGEHVASQGILWAINEIEPNSERASE